MFFNTAIGTYLWIISNRKPASRKGQVQLIDGSGFWRKLRKAQGDKRKELAPRHIEQITQLFCRAEDADLATIIDADGKEVGREIVWTDEKAPEAPEGGRVKIGPLSRVFAKTAFGYRTVTVERPLLDGAGKPILSTRGKNKGKPEPDVALRHTENVPLNEDIHAYFEREVLPHAPDAWIDEKRTKVGYEIPFTRQFYVFEPPRSLEKIDEDLKQVTDRIKTMLQALAA
jgi:type I restriction enzyme M protein